MSTARSTMIQRILAVSHTETDLQKLAYGAKGVDTLLGSGQDAEGAGYYGVIYDENEDTVTRVGSNALHLTLPIQTRMRRCLLDDEGSVLGYLNPWDSNYMDDGSPAALDGSNGQVMVEVPAFYQRYEYDDGKHMWLISEQPAPGFSLHPDYIKDGSAVLFRYVGAYECVRTGGGGTALMHSVSGEYPYRGGTRAQFRLACRNRGRGWRMYTYSQHSALVLLALIEYASFDFSDSSRMTAGRTGLTGGSYVEGEYVAKTGLSNGLGNRTGGVSVQGVSGWATDFMSYRGIENFFGHLEKVVDGLVIDGRYNHEAPIPFFWSNNDAHFHDESSDGMALLGHMPRISSDEGWVKSLVPNLAFGFVGADDDGSSTSGIHGFYRQYANRDFYRLPLVSSNANSMYYQLMTFQAQHDVTSTSRSSSSSRLAF